MSNNNNRLLELDALRGIASLMVVLFHFTLDRPESEPLFELGVTGVDLFFIISGFVIFMSLNKMKKPIDFIINRLSRLYPTYWTAVTFTFLLIIGKILFLGTSEPIPWIKYFANMTMFHYYLQVPDLDGPYWTMTIELLFYISMGFMFWFKWLKHIIPIGFGVLILLATYDILLTYTALIDLDFYFPLMNHFPLFFSGIIFYFIYKNKINKLKGTIILIFAILLQIGLFDNGGRSKIYLNLYQYASMLVLYYSCFVFILLGKLKFIINQGTLFLGKISYSLYLIHQFITLAILLPFLEDYLGINFWVASIGIILPFLLLLSYILYYFIERPSNFIMKTWLSTVFNRQKN